MGHAPALKYSVKTHSVPGVLVVKNLPPNAGDTKVTGSIPGPGKSPGGRHGNPLQYPCLENPMDREAWQATDHRVAKSQTRLKQVSRHTLKHSFRNTLLNLL